MRDRRSGSFIAEYVAVIVVIFLCLLFPLINLVTAGLRYCLVLQAVHDGLQAAAPATTFTVASGTNSVMNLGPTAIADTLSKYTGISNTSIRTRIKSTDIATQTVTDYPWDTKLAAPAAQTSIYTIECQVSADVEPLINFGGVCQMVPGICGPMHVDIAAQELTENPAGMNQ